MSFGDREDELWEAMKPSFKPRLVSDPNIKYAKHLVNQTGPFTARNSVLRAITSRSSSTLRTPHETGVDEALFAPRPHTDQP